MSRKITSLMLRQEQIIRTHKPSSYYFLQRISLQLGFIYKVDEKECFACAISSVLIEITSALITLSYLPVSTLAKIAPVSANSSCYMIAKISI